MNLTGVQTANINQAHFAVRFPTGAESHLSAKASAKQFQSDGKNFMHMCVQRAKLVGSLPCSSQLVLFTTFVQIVRPTAFFEWVLLVVKFYQRTRKVLHRYAQLSPATSGPTWSTWEIGSCECRPVHFHKALGLLFPWQWLKEPRCTVQNHAQVRIYFLHGFAQKEGTYDWFEQF